MVPGHKDQAYGLGDFSKILIADTHRQMLYSPWPARHNTLLPTGHSMNERHRVHCISKPKAYIQPSKLRCHPPRGGFAHAPWTLSRTPERRT